MRYLDVKKKKVSVPLYPVDIVFIVTDDLRGYVVDHLGAWIRLDEEELDALTISPIPGSPHASTIFCIFEMAEINKIPLPRIVGHELTHVKNYIISHISAKLDPDNDEYEAYLTGWMYEKLYNWLYAVDSKR